MQTPLPALAFWSYLQAEEENCIRENAGRRSNFNINHVKMRHLILLRNMSLPRKRFIHYITAYYIRDENSENLVLNS